MEQQTVRYLGKDIPAFERKAGIVGYGAEGATDNYKAALNINVYEAAKARARHIFNSYDNVIVSFSAGKDSLVVLELMDAVRIEMGIEKKITVVFYDEELIPDTVIDFAAKYYHSGRFDFRWYCVPLISEKFVLGKKEKYIQWDEGRQWVRPKPEWSLGKESLPDYDKPCSQAELANYYTKTFTGSICINLGLRAQESLNRLKGVLRNTNKAYPFLSEGPTKQITESKIIYDWTTDDVFKFFYDQKIKYCTIYDWQGWARKSVKQSGGYRVATPLHAEATPLWILKKYDPVFFDRVCLVFPDVRNQERYAQSYNREAFMLTYGITPEGIFNWIQDTCTGSLRVLAEKTLKSALELKKASKDDDMGGMPLYYIFTSFVRGSWKRGIGRLRKEKITAKMRQYENYKPVEER